MENKHLKIGRFIRDAFLLSFAAVWFGFIIIAITTTPAVDCSGKTEVECKSLKQKADDKHRQAVSNLLAVMG
ncbi:hypothetical protein HFN89_03755 [Rhizobium laguerreae]|nr:hypothetical protein [Rhizobium laguerreae]